MEDSIKPQNSVILGGHHNKLIGGENVTFIGAEYSKASGKAHQVIMGKYNRDCAADLIYGCGHFDGESYIQNEKEYSVSELKTIETMNGTIQNVRASSKLENALEFYAHQGKMILRNCDDGYDRNNGARSNAYGMSVTLDPTGIQFRDGNDKIIGEMYADDLKKDSETIIYVDFQQASDTLPVGYFYIQDWETSSDELNKRWNNMSAKERFEDLFYVDYNNKIPYPGETGAHYEFMVQRDTNLVGPDKLKAINDAFFKNQNSQNIVIIFSEYSRAVNENLSWTADFELYLKIYPYYTEQNKACRYMGKKPVSLKIFRTGTSTQSRQSYLKILYDKTTLYTSSLICTNKSLSWNTSGNNNRYSTDYMRPGKIVQFNSIADSRHICPWIEL